MTPPSTSGAHAQEIRADDPRLAWLGAVSLERRGGWVQPWRLPVDELELHAPELVDRASRPAGVRLAFDTDATWLQGQVEPCAEPALMDLFAAGELVGSADLQDATGFSFELPAGEKRVASPGSSATCPRT